MEFKVLFVALLLPLMSSAQITFSRSGTNPNIIFATNCLLNTGFTDNVGATDVVFNTREQCEQSCVVNQLCTHFTARIVPAANAPALSAAQITSLQTLEQNIRSAIAAYDPLVTASTAALSAALVAANSPTATRNAAVTTANTRSTELTALSTAATTASDKMLGVNANAQNPILQNALDQAVKNANAANAPAATAVTNANTAANTAANANAANKPAAATNTEVVTRDAVAKIAAARQLHAAALGLVGAAIRTGQNPAANPATTVQCTLRNFNGIDRSVAVAGNGVTDVCVINCAHPTAQC